jgi:hypothetical protein
MTTDDTKSSACDEDTFIEHMLITRKSILSGIVRTRDLPVSAAQMLRYEFGMPVQKAFPELSADDREFISTGIVEGEWPLKGSDD